MSSPFSNLRDAAPEDAARYIQAVLSLLGDRDSHEVLGETANRLREVLEVFDRERLALPEAPGKWSAADVLHHFADSELVWGWRLRMLLTADRPTLQGYDQDTWADRLHTPDDDPARSVELFRLLREGHLDLIGRATPEDLARVSVHDERGEESLEHMVRLYAGHDLVYLRQLRRLLQLDG